jgi:hypothetical protein
LGECVGLVGFEEGGNTVVEFSGDFGCGVGVELGLDDDESLHEVGGCFVVGLEVDESFENEPDFVTFAIGVGFVVD